MAREFKKEIYKLSAGFPSDEKYGYTSQIRRASYSITVNLAEGTGRSSNQDKAHFTNMAYASALEVLDHLIGVYDLDMITHERYVDLRQKMDKIINKLNALYKHQLNDPQTLKNRLKSDR